MTVSMRELADSLSARLRRGEPAVFSVLFLSLCVAAGAFSVSRGTDANFDLLNYHLYVPHAFFEGRLFFDVAPAQLQSYFPPLLDLPYYLMIKNFNDWPRVIAFIQGVQAGIYAFFAFVISLFVAKEIFPDRLTAWISAIIATAFGLTGAAFASVVGTTTGDVPMSALALASLAAVMNALRKPNPSTWHFVVAGLLTGVAMAGKLTAIMYCAPIGLIVLLWFRLRDALAFAISATGCFLLLWAPHAWHLWIETGNPLFPMYNNLFRSPEWLLEPIRTALAMPPDTWLLLLPFYWAVRQHNITQLWLQDIRIALLFVAFIVWPIVGFRRTLLVSSPTSLPDRARSFLRRHRVAIPLMLFLLLSYAIWLKLFLIYRYFIVAETLSGTALLFIFSRIYRNRTVPVIASLAAAFIAANVFVERPDWGHVPHGSKTIDVNVSSITAGSLLITADDSGLAYVIPFLPRDVRVIGAYTNFVRPGAHGLNRRTADIIRAHVGAIYVMAASNRPESDLAARLDRYEISISECSIVRSNLVLEGHRLCRGTRRSH